MVKYHWGHESMYLYATVKVNSMSEYILHIPNENGDFDILEFSTIHQLLQYVGIQGFRLDRTITIGNEQHIIFYKNF